MKSTMEILTKLQENSQKNHDEIFTRLYRYLLRPDIYFIAYQHLYSNKGAGTKGVNDDTADGFSEQYVTAIIEALRTGSYEPKPVRRTYIQKKNGKLRPLGLPVFADKLVQEAIRMILEAIYEPIFSIYSHGFRPGRSCHTALAMIKHEFTGAKWFIEGDIKGCFDNIDHPTLIGVLNRKIKDARFLNLIRMFLKAGYMEDWNFHETYSGCPQGGIISPILANIYLNELDRYITQLKKEFDHGYNPRNFTEEYNTIRHKRDTRRTDSLGEANPLTGKVFCGECGSLMYNHRRKNGRVRVYYTSKGERRESYSKPEDCYACSKHILTRQTYKAACSGHHIRTSALRSIVLECIRKTCSYVQSNPEEFLELYNQISESQNQSHLQELRSRITKAEHRTKDIDALIRKIYEDNIAGRLSDKMLENLLEGYEKEKNELEEEQKDCQQQLDSAEKQADNTNHFIELAKKYTDFSELTPAMVNEFVSKIIVHRPFELNGTRAVQVEVYLNYIGKFDVPEEPMILSEEELATQKIREEKLEKHRIASRKYMAKYRKRLKEMKKAGTILPENLPAETKGEWL